MAISETSAGGLPGRLVDNLASLFRAVMTQRFVTWVSGAIFAAFIALMALTPFLHPAYNWDLAPYLAIAMEDDIPDHAELHKKVWDIMEAGATPDQFNQLKTVNDYNKAQYANPEFFFSQLVLYRVKIGYTTLLKVFGPTLGYVETTQIINALSTLAIGVVLMLWLRRENIMQGALVLGPMMLMAGFIFMTQLAVPDLLGTALLLTGAYLLRTGRDWWAVPFLFLAFVVRTDVIILLFALVLATMMFGGRVLPKLAAFVLAAAFYVPISSHGGHPGWWAHYYFTNVQIQNDLRGFAPDFSVVDYIKGQLRGISSSFRFNNWLELFAVVTLAWLVLLRHGQVPRSGVVTMLLAAQFLAIGGKFLVFPLPESRVYFPYMVIIVITLLELWRPRFDLETTPVRTAG